MSDVLLLEPSFADVAKAIEGAVDLTAQTRTQRLCSLRQVAKALNKPMEAIPARWTAARFSISRLHHAVIGLNPKTLANHKANVRAALRWFGKDGETGGCKDAKTLSDQITERVEKATGLFITVHQFRHAAAAIWLQYKPGDYETVRRILGHKRLQTTINFYCGLETLQANRDFGDLVRKIGAPQEDPPQPGSQP